jgi:glutathione-independent formaldehyde dehydrogenase
LWQFTRHPLNIRCNIYLRDLIVSGRAKPGFVVTHRLALGEAPAACRKFDKHLGNYIKVVLNPGSCAAS